MISRERRVDPAAAYKSDPARKAGLAALARRLACVHAACLVPGLGEDRGTHAPGLGAIDACFPAGGLPMAAVHEIWTDRASARPAASGFAIALACHLARARRGRRAGGDLVWVYPRGHAREWGLLYGPGLMAFGHDPGRFILVEAPGTIEALWAGEEALRAAVPGGVVIAVDDAYGRHAFMASRRLELAARAGGSSAFVLCHGTETPASAASLRWRIAPMPGRAHGRDQGRDQGRDRTFPARLRWLVTLERNRRGHCGAWIVEWNHETATLASTDTDAGAMAGALVGRTGADERAPERRSADLPGIRASA